MFSIWCRGQTCSDPSSFLFLGLPHVHLHSPTLQANMISSLSFLLIFKNSHWRPSVLISRVYWDSLDLKQIVLTLSGLKPIHCFFWNKSYNLPNTFLLLTLPQARDTRMGLGFGLCPFHFLWMWSHCWFIPGSLLVYYCITACDFWVPISFLSVLFF